MVFFNYSTMQMAAKIVYYGPGLCGKTTNLQHVYGHTSLESRGEMVSLETETDRTLFFDLLPLDVGSIQGFNTRIQLYTVPGQVFYNTTRKLVLKGVDGVVFVADSQKPMLQANIESFGNLEENLAELGLSVDELPVVLQYNKRDLPDVCSIEELNEALNRNKWPYYEASAIDGRGVFETLKGISKLTLLSLKKRIAASQRGGSPAVGSRTRSASQPPKPRPAPAGQASPKPPEQAAAVTAPPASAAPVAAAPAAVTPPPAPDRAARRPVDILAELEKIRRQTLGATHAPAPAPPAAPVPADPAASPAIPPSSADPADTEDPAPAASGPQDSVSGASMAEPSPRSSNGSRELAHEVQLSLPRSNFSRARHFSISLQVEDESHQVVDSYQDGFALEDPSELDRLLLHLKIALQPSE